MARTKTAIIQLKVRMREDLRKRLEQEAKKAAHSLNQEVVRRLEESFEIDGSKMLLEEARLTLQDARETRAQNLEAVAALARLQAKPEVAQMLDVAADLARQSRSAGEAVIDRIKGDKK